MEKKTTTSGSRLSIDIITQYRERHAPLHILFFVTFGGFLAFTMEIAGKENFYLKCILLAILWVFSSYNKVIVTL